jgi:pyruvate formate lyase activating enzyme
LSQENNISSVNPSQLQIKEVPFYDKLDGGVARCRVCEFQCEIQPGSRGACRVRYNEDGKLYTRNFGVISQADIELIEKHHFYHLFPGSKVFSLGGFGQNFPSIGGQDEFDEVPNPPGRILAIERFIKFAIEQRCRGIVFAYNEPTMWYEYMREGCINIKANGMFSAIVSNGYLTTEALEQVGHYIDAMMLQLNAFSDQTFNVLTGQGHFQKVLETATRFQRRFKGHLEISTKLVPGVNDSNSELTTIVAWISRVIGENTAWHLSCALPEGEDSDEVMQKAKEIGRSNGLRYIYLHGLSKPQPLPEPGDPNPSFDITAANNTYCYSCHALIVDRSRPDAHVVGLEGNRCSNCNTELGVRTTIWKL